MPSPTRFQLARVAGRGASMAAHLRGGKASVFPGYVALRVMPDLLATLLAERPARFVSGTNGKTTTTALIAAALGSGTATNQDGANLPAGWATALLDAPPTAPAVLEVDEAYLPAALDAAPEALAVLLNLTRDQLDRHSETRMLAVRWHDALTAHPDVRVVANVDDPLVTWAASAATNVTWAAGGAEWHDDAAACPSCGSLLQRDGTAWSCTGCELRRPEPTVTADAHSVRIDGIDHPVRLALPGRANRGNLALAVAAARELGVPIDRALTGIASVREVSGRYARHQVNGHEVIVLLAKNPAGWGETLEIIGEILPEQSGTVVVAINARGPDGRDPSWLWDVPFEKLAGRPVIATGERATDLAVRLDHAGVTYTKDTRPPLVAASAATADPVVIAATYTNFLSVSRELARAMADPVDIALIFPELLGTYGDGGNALVLARRLEKRGIQARILEIGIDDPIPRSAAIYLLGGGEDAPQFTALDALRRSGALAAAVDANAVVLAVCAGYQLVGSTLTGPEGRTIDGLGLLDAATTRAPERLVGEVAVHDDVLDTGWIVGFENHRGVTTPSNGATPLGARTPLRGIETDGAVHGRVVGTYLHGPVLARDPRFADRLLEWAVGPLQPLDDPQADLLHRERYAEVVKSRGQHDGEGRRWPRVNLRRRP